VYSAQAVNVLNNIVFYFYFILFYFLNNQLSWYWKFTMPTGIERPCFYPLNIKPCPYCLVWSLTFSNSIPRLQFLLFFFFWFKKQEESEADIVRAVDERASRDWRGRRKREEDRFCFFSFYESLITGAAVVVVVSPVVWRLHHGRRFCRSPLLLLLLLRLLDSVFSHRQPSAGCWYVLL
jgi:hypothetical protein